MITDPRSTMRLILAVTLLAATLCSGFTIKHPKLSWRIHIQTQSRTLQKTTLPSKKDDSMPEAPSPAPPPVLNGKTVMPLHVIKQGLEGHKIAAVYSLISSEFRRGSDGWKDVSFVGTTMDLFAALSDMEDNYDPGSMAYVRALSFSFPKKAAMEDVANRWREFVKEAGGSLQKDADDLLRTAQIEAMKAFAFDDDNDDDEDDDDDNDIDGDELDIMSAGLSSLQMNRENEEAVVSPFANGSTTGTEKRDLPFTAESVNIILEEVRPYLISDGGNVSVDRVDESNNNVYLKLEGACGSCPSSTVTMQMGIERVLRENFPSLNQVIQIDGEEEKPTELTLDMILLECNRIGPAINAMGGKYEITSVDPLGVVEIKFKGPNKLQQGLQLALLDVPLVKHVKFTMFDE